MISGNELVRQSEIVKVVFGTAYTDVDIPTELKPELPDQIDYEVIKISVPGTVYHDASADRVKWVHGLIRLRCSVDDAIAELRLSIRAETTDFSWTGQDYTPPVPAEPGEGGSLAEGEVYDIHVNAAAAISWSKISKSGSKLSDLASRVTSDLTDEAYLARRNATNTFTANQVIGAYNLTIDSGLLFVDATNNRVGVNQGTPLYSLDLLEGNGQLGKAFRVQYGATSLPLMVGVTRSTEDAYLAWNATQDSSGDDQKRQIAAGAGRVRLEANSLTLRAAATSTAGSVITWGEGVGLIPGVLSPTANYAVDLGSLTSKYLSLWAGELRVENLVAQDVISTIGGRILVGTTTQLVEACADSDDHIHVKHNSLANHDTVYLNTFNGTSAQLEFMLVTSSASGSAGNYSYSVTRNLDGTGANTWLAGDSVFNTGDTGDGFIDLYALTGLTTGYGPTIVGNIRTARGEAGAHYADWAPRWAIGNLNGLYGYSSGIMGAAFGDLSNVWLSINTTDGVVAKKGNTARFQLAPDGSGLLANGGISWDTAGTITINGGTTGGWTIDASKISSTYAHLNSAGYISFGSTPPTSYGNNVGTWLGYSSGAKVSLYADASNYLQWDGSKLLIKGANFTLDSSGNLTASSATISGTITVTGGNAATQGYADQAEADAKAYAQTEASGAYYSAVAACLDKTTFLDTTTIKGGLITTNSITANKLVLVSGGLINTDPLLTDITAWEAEIAYGAISFQTVADAPVGTTVIRSANNSHAAVHDIRYYPIDPLKTYRVRFWAHGVGATGILYMCLRQYTSPGTPCASNGGRNPYKPSGVTVSGWTEYSYTWGPADWQSGVKFVRMDWLLNYPNPGNAGYMEICHPRFEEMRGAELIVDGTITAAKFSTLGGWTWSDTYFASASAGMAPADYPFYAGATYANRATGNFRVNTSGAVTAKTGTVGGWTLGTYSLTAGTGTDSVGLLSNASAGSTAIYAGHATPASAPFRVMSDGEAIISQVTFSVGAAMTVDCGTGWMSLLAATGGTQNLTYGWDPSQLLGTIMIGGNYATGGSLIVGGGGMRTIELGTYDANNHFNGFWLGTSNSAGGIVAGQSVSAGDYFGPGSINAKAGFYENGTRIGGSGAGTEDVWLPTDSITLRFVNGLFVSSM